MLQDFEHCLYFASASWGGILVLVRQCLFASRLVTVACKAEEFGPGKKIGPPYVDFLWTNSTNLNVTSKTAFWNLSSLSLSIMVVPQNLPGLCQGIKSRTKLLESLWVKIASAFSTNGFSLITKKITSLWCVLKQHTHNEMYEEKKFVASMYHSIFELKIWKKPLPLQISRPFWAKSSTTYKWLL